MKNPERIIGEKFYRLLVVELAGQNKYRQQLVRCICDCGREKVVVASDLRSGNTSSCGCWHREIIREKQISHGMSYRSEYQSWSDAKQRCNNKAHPRYADWGGRGISMHQGWLDSFEAFYEHVGPKPARYVLDRKNNDGNYEPGNVRWVSYHDSNLNRRKKVR